VFKQLYSESLKANWNYFSILLRTGNWVCCQ